MREIRPKTNIHKVGQLYINTRTNKFLLVQTVRNTNIVGLIHMDTGTLHSATAQVQDIRNITDIEFEAVTDNKGSEFQVHVGEVTFNNE